MADAVRRELREELALEATRVGVTLYKASDPGTPFEIHFVEVEATGEPVPLEHEELRWMSAREMTEVQFAPSDARFLSHCVLVELIEDPLPNR